MNVGDVGDVGELGEASVAVNAGACVRCAACTSLAPAVFHLGRDKADGPSGVLRAPRDEGERVRCEVAVRMCPTGAVRVGPAREGVESPSDASGDDFLRDALYYALFDEAEKARWRMTDIPWSEVRRELASAALVEHVRANAAAELTAFTASRRFLQEFADDADFSQWITVWAYEETKHPQVLMRWLSRLGHTFDASFILRGRWASPFLRSRVAMLATNVVSEMVASAGYVRLARRASEPVLAKIAMLLAGDEARHASSFFRYAQRAIARAEDPDAERAAALRVLHVWLNEPDKMGHPVKAFQGVEGLRDGESADPLASAALRSRICDVFSKLVERRVTPTDDLSAMARETRRRASPT